MDNYIASQPDIATRHTPLQCEMSNNPTTDDCKNQGNFNKRVVIDFALRCCFVTPLPAFVRQLTGGFVICIIYIIIYTKIVDDKIGFNIVMLPPEL